VKLRAKLVGKEEKDQVNASKINDGEDVQGVELQIGQEAAPNSSSGCCSML
jgi:hypothetical protein